MALSRKTNRHTLFRSSIKASVAAFSLFLSCSSGFKYFLIFFFQNKKMEKEEYHVYCDKDGPEIDVQETKFWKKKIRKYLKPLEQDKNKEKAATEAFIMVVFSHLCFCCDMD
jgi:hypothetical protein